MRQRPSISLKDVMLYGIVIIFFCAAFSLFLAQVSARSDFWWHLLSGKWITVNYALPFEDPFSYTSTPGADSRETLILKGYWLIQVCYHLVFSMFGLTGNVVFNALMLTIGLLAVYKSLRLYSLSIPASLVLSSVGVFFLNYYSDPRPQLASFMFFPVFIYMINKGLQDLRGRSLRKRHFLLLPFVGLLWAQLHPGYILIYPLLSVYIFSESYKYIKRNDALGREQFWIFIAASTATMIACFLNPAGYLALSEGITGIMSRETQVFVAEYRPPWVTGRHFGNIFIYGFFGYCAALYIVVLIRIKQISLTDVLLLVGLGTAGLSGFRFTIFFLLVSLVIMGKLLSPVLNGPARGKLYPVTAILAAMCIGLIFNAALQSSVLSKGTFLQGIVSLRAVQFLQNNNLRGPIFNSYEWGAYMGWVLWPTYKTFIDNRMLEYDVFNEYLRIMDSGSLDGLNRHGVKTVVLNHMDLLNKTMRPIILALLRTQEWKIVYYDIRSVIFVRNGTVPESRYIDKSKFLNELIVYLKWLIKNNPSLSTAYIVLAQLYMEEGKYSSALDMLRDGYDKSAETARISALITSLEGQAP